MPNQKPLPEAVADLNKAYTPEEIAWAQARPKATDFTDSQWEEFER